MSKYVDTYNVSYKQNHMGQGLHGLEEYIDAHLEHNSGLKVKQVEMLWGNSYGARVAVVYEELVQKVEQL